MSIKQYLSATAFAIVTLFCASTVSAQRGDVVSLTNLYQPDNRIYVKMAYDRTVGGMIQDVGVMIQNKTSDELVVHLEFNANTVCGKRPSMKVGVLGDGLRLKPHESKGGKGSWWDSENLAFDVVAKTGDNCKGKEIEKGKFSRITDVGFHIISIENVSEKKRQEDRDRKDAADKKERERIAKDAADKKEKERIAKDNADKAEKERIAKDAADKKEKEHLATDKNKTSAASTSKSTTSTATSTASNTSATSKQTQQQANTPPTITKEEQVAQTMDRIRKADDDYWNNVRATNKMLEEKTDLYLQSFYVAQNGKEASERVKELTTLRGDFQTVEQVEQAYRDQMQNINQAVSAQTEANKNSINAYIAAQNYGANDQDRAVNNLAGGIANFINDAGEDKRKREAREKLERQRSEAIAKINERKRIAEEKRIVALRATRKQVLDQYADGGIPAYSDLRTANTIYFFGYDYDPADKFDANKRVKVTRVFSVTRYGDGTWPFKDDIKNRMANSAKNFRIVGYYRTRDLAETQRSTFIDNVVKVGFGTEVLASIDVNDYVQGSRVSHSWTLE